MEKLYDIDEIKEQFRAVIAESQGITDPKVDKLFNDWERNKQDFIRMFGGKLIWQYPEKLTFSLDSRVREERVDELIEHISSVYRNSQICDFIDDNRSDFFRNKLSNDYTYNDKKVPRGTKVIKAFKYFENNKETLRLIQDCASRVIQEDKIEGYFCISVHPLDYLSSSQNNYNWRSCHSLDGEYRAGNLSYMGDNATVVCYIKGEKDEAIPLFPFTWNSKKWRMLLHFSKDRNFVFAGRQYPFSSWGTLDFIHDKFLSKKIPSSSPFCGWNRWTDGRIANILDSYGEKTPLRDSYIDVLGHLRPLRDVCQDVELDHSLHFNDILHSSCYIPHYIGFEDFNNPDAWETVQVKVGSVQYCLRCGEKEIYNGETMMCSECEFEYGNSCNDDFGFCDCCGARMYNDDASWVAGAEEYVCPHCADNECFICKVCGELHYRVEMVYCEDTQEYLCKDCYEERYE